MKGASLRHLNSKKGEECKTNYSESDLQEYKTQMRKDREKRKYEYWWCDKSARQNLTFSPFQNRAERKIRYSNIIQIVIRPKTCIRICMIFSK